MNGECLASLLLTLSITKEHFNGPSASEHAHVGACMSMWECFSIFKSVCQCLCIFVLSAHLLYS